MPTVGDTITIGFYDSFENGNSAASIAPEYLIEERSFVITLHDDPPDFNGVHDWLAEDEFGSVNARINFDYENGPFELEQSNEAGNQLINPLLFAISASSGLSQYTPTLTWAISGPAIPSLFVFGETIAIDVGGLLLPSPASGNSLRLSLVWQPPEFYAFKFRPYGFAYKAETDFDLQYGFFAPTDYDYNGIAIKARSLVLDNSANTIALRVVINRRAAYVGARGIGAFNLHGADYIRIEASEPPAGSVPVHIIMSTAELDDNSVAKFKRVLE